MSVAVPETVAALRLGPYEVWPPVVLAPMAGVTNAPFRTLCRAYGGGNGIFVNEMLSAQALRYGNEKSWAGVHFEPEEHPRSLQLYVTDPADVAPVVERLAAEDLVDHIDLNFGCPAPKVTRKGGGAAIPLRPRLLEAIVRCTVERACGRPVTMKFRTGIDDDLLTYLDAGRIGEQAGCAAVALHGRTAAQLYDGEADWNAIAALKQHVTSIPVLGNGDIFEATDALRMIEQTGCDGVVIGRGCLGRPWLFGDLEAAFAGRPAPRAPSLGEVRNVVLHHAELLCAYMGERRAIVDLRKHLGWYLKGYPVGFDLRRHFAQIHTLADVEALLRNLDPHGRPDAAATRAPRGKRSGRQRVALPAGYLTDRQNAAPPVGAGMISHGG